MEMRQVKTPYTYTTLKEAKAALGRNANKKQQKKTSGTTRKIPFHKALKDYTEYYREGWSDSYAGQKAAQAKRMSAYFNDRDVRTIDTRDIEEFFKWCREPQVGFMTPLSNNSIQKLRTHLYDLWKFMKKNPHKYEVKENVVADAESGGEGKSRIGRVMRALLGDNMNIGSIQKLATDRFSRADQEGKQSVQGVLYVLLMGFGNGQMSALYDRSGVRFFNQRQDSRQHGGSQKSR